MDVMADDGSFGQSNDALRLFNATRYSRMSEIVSRPNYVNSSHEPLGVGGAPVKTQIRGILKQMNVGDVNSIVDNLTKGVSSLITGKGAMLNQSA